MSSPRPPNILFLLLDCLRSRAVFDRSRGQVIPTIDALLGRGTAFPQTVATATTTSPSMATLFTGVLPFRHGIRSLRGYKLEPTVATIAEVLRDHGYYTHAEATGPVVAHKDFDRGFDTFRHRKGTLYTKQWDAVREAMRALPGDRPWFLYLHFWELHRPRYLPKRFDSSAYGKHRYERALSALDEARLPAILELAGENAVVALTGDHGEIPRWDFGQRAARKLGLKRLKRFIDVRSGHGHDVTEDLVLVPLILAGPGVPAGRRVEAAVRHLDVFPTLLDLAGIDDPRRVQCQGESLVPLFEPTAGDGDRPGYSEAVGVTLGGGPERWLVSVRHEGWKYVRRAQGEERWLWKLPDEARDRSADHPEVVDRMEGLLNAFLSGEDLTRTGQDLSATESAEVEAHLRELGYLD